MTTIPTTKMILSWLVLLSINLITVLLRPSILAMSRTFLWTPLSVELWSRKFENMLEPVSINSSRREWAEDNLEWCWSAGSMYIEVSWWSFVVKVRSSKASLSCSSWDRIYLTWVKYNKNYNIIRRNECALHSKVINNLRETKLF